MVLLLELSTIFFLETFNILVISSTKIFIFSKLLWLEEKLEQADKELYKIYNGEKSKSGEDIHGIFSDVIDIIKTYGGAENGIDIAIESSISEKNLLSDNTNLSYRQEGEIVHFQKHIMGWGIWT